MDHDEVVRQKMTERYLLDELDPDKRDEFEEHFFDCRECALDVRAGSVFVEQSKIALAEKSAVAVMPGPAPVPAQAGWFGWLRPALSVSALALLLAVIAYQNLVSYPRREQALNRPQVLPWTMITVGTRGTSVPMIAVPPGTGFLLFVRIPPEGSYVSYKADLYNPAGRPEWSLTIPAKSADDTWPVQVPGTNREAGSYTLAVSGVTATGESKEVGRAPFELQIRK